MARYCAHGIIGYTGGGSLTDPRGISKKRVKAAIAALEIASAVLPIDEHCEPVAVEETYIVEVYVHPTVMGKYKVPDCVSPLYRMGVVVKGIQKPRIFSGYQLT